jgi:hypothetical protein
MNSEKDKLAYAAVYGTILGFYDITDIPINTVAVTKDDKKIYAIVYNPEPEIVVFDLSI